MRRPTAGFTLIELVTCIVILGILAISIGPKFFADNSFSTRGYADELAAALRYSQAVAVSSTCSVRFTLTAGGYQAQQPANGPPACSGAWSTSVLRADGSALSGAPPSGVSVSPAVQIVFDAQGRTGGATSNIQIGNPVAYTLGIDPGSGLVSFQ